MGSDEDNFDIDVYGDGGEEFLPEAPVLAETEPSIAQVDGAPDKAPYLELEPVSALPQDQITPSKADTTPLSAVPSGQKIASTDESSSDLVLLPKQAPQSQGVKRKDGEKDDRPLDPNATSALFISDLHWWITDDDIRGWANQSQCEDELDDITFNEHKVNGKSKG